MPLPITPLETSSFTWHDGMLVGYTPMDAVHEEFALQIDALLRAPDSAILGALDALAGHAREHFGDEESWMAETDFPARTCHAAEHAAVMTSIEGVRRRVAEGEAEAARRLARALADWFPGHADYMDAALAHWMCKRRLGGKPIVVRRCMSASAPVINA
jgi:hemerythrin